MATDDILYDFWYVAVRYQKVHGAKWFQDTFKPYRVVELKAHCQDVEVYMLIENTEEAVSRLRNRLSVIFNLEDSFDVWGEGYTLEMSIEQVLENLDFLVCYSSTIQEINQLSHEKLLVIDNLKAKSRRINRCRYVDEYRDNPTQFFKNLTLKSENLYTYLDRLFVGALLKYSSMIPINSSVREMKVWFVGVFGDAINLDPKSLMGRYSNKLEDSSFSRDSTTISETGVTSEHRHVTHHYANTDMSVPKKVVQHYKDIDRFLPDRLSLISDRQTFLECYVDRVGNFSSYELYGNAICKYFCSFLSNMTYRDMYWVHYREIKMFLRGQHSVSSILSTVSNDVIWVIIKLLGESYATERYDTPYAASSYRRYRI